MDVIDMKQVVQILQLSTVSVVVQNEVTDLFEESEHIGIVQLYISSPKMDTVDLSLIFW